MIDQEKIQKRKNKEEFEWNQIQYLLQLELQTGIILKPGDKITFYKDKGKRKTILENLIQKSVLHPWDVEKREKFFETTLSVETGKFQALTSNLVYTGIGVVVENIIFPILLIESINDVLVDWENINAYEL